MAHGASTSPARLSLPAATPDLWAACREHVQLVPLAGEAVRVVESQEQVATSTLVRDLAEQALLEDMLERVKPPRRAGTQRLHYLLATPFRYPPLTHGSRFASRFEPGLYYAARGIAPALAETAYYRLYFFHGMAQPPPSGRLLTQHTAFAARIRTRNGMRLHAPPFAAHERALRDPVRYAATQRLGAALREYGVEAFEYLSARDVRRGINVALFAPRALASPRPLWQQAWLCQTRAEEVAFSRAGDGEVRRFPIAQFLVDGRLPQPAG